MVQDMVKNSKTCVYLVIDHLTGNGWISQFCVSYVRADNRPSLVTVICCRNIVNYFNCVMRSYGSHAGQGAGSSRSLAN